MSKKWRVIAVLAVTATIFVWTVLIRTGQQRADEVPQIGFLSTGPQTYHADFWRGLESLGYHDGKNIIVRSKIGKGQSSELPGLVEDLIVANVRLIVATNTVAVRAVLNRTTTIPVVMVTSATPIESNFIESYSRPGRNVTGVTMAPPDSAAKTFQLLREVVPGIKRITVLWSSTNPIHPPYLKQINKQAHQYEVSVKLIDIQLPQDIDAAFIEIGNTKADGLIVLVDQAINRNRERIVELANLNRVPAIYPFQDFTKSGGLMSYGVEFSALHYRAARYVDKIIKGGSVKEMPVEQPSKFELIVNKKTAEQLNIEIPMRLLMRADAVIE